MEDEIRADLLHLVTILIPTIRDDYRAPGEEDGPPSMQLTAATDDAMTCWGFQTGDNSYTGGAYGLPHWAVVSLYKDSDPADVVADIFDQWAELTPDCDTDEPTQKIDVDD